MRLTHELLNKTGETATVSTILTPIYPAGHDDETGLVQVSHSTGTAAITAFVYGRIGASQLWHEVYASGEVASGATASKAIAIYPQMYVKVVVAGGATCSFVMSIQE